VNVTETDLPGALILEPKVFGDGRGFFMEIWSQRRYAEFGVLPNFVQDNLSYSKKGVLRGLHFQNPDPQGKLVFVLQGEVFDVAVDIRIGSPTFGQWVGVNLSAENKRQFYVPEGFAHGFIVTSEAALFSYKCTSYYNPQTEQILLWSDPDLGIVWPIEAPVLSAKDGSAPHLTEIPTEKLPKYGAALI
jgi:dTDP-4-dehydrorhamnose 3,5-epimerase